MAESKDKKQKKVLFICPPSTIDAYSKSRIKVAIPEIPLLSLASLGAMLIEAGHDVRISDLSISKSPKKTLLKDLADFNPDFVGLTFTTPLYRESMITAELVKKFNSNITVMAGGVHPSALPEEVVQNDKIDLVIVGEGDYTVVDVVSGKNLRNIDGICFKDKSGKAIRTRPRELIQDINKLPLPAWHLYDLKKYRTSRLNSRKNPVGPLQTSRGCVYGCKFCNKNVFGRKTRMKSPERVLQEIEHLKRSGFRDMHIWDDTFNTDMARAKKICDMMAERKIKMPFSLANGIRVDLVDDELFTKLKRAGCYQMGLGIESGNQELLDRINKGTKLEQIRDAVKLAKKHGIEVVGFFMLALPGETAETIKKTIEFARELNPDFAKVTITVPFPSTQLFYDYEKEGRIKTKDWAKYNFHHTSEIYDHENLDWATIQKYYMLFYRKFYFRPGYIARMLIKGVRTGNIFYYAYYFLKTWSPF